MTVAGETLIVLAHPFDAVVSLFRATGRGSKLQAPSSFRGPRSGMIVRLATLGGVLYLLRSQAIEVCDGTRIVGRSAGLPRDADGANLELQANDIALAWDRPSIDTEHGTYLLEGDTWRHIADAGHARALVFDAESDELWRCRGRQISAVAAGGKVTTWSVDAELWEATHHAGHAIGFGDEQLFHLVRGKLAHPIAKVGPAPKNRSLLSTDRGLWFCGYDGVVWRSPDGLRDWRPIWDSNRNPVPLLAETEARTKSTRPRKR